MRLLRQKLGKTQEELASDLGYSSRSKLAGYESGSSKPSFDDLVFIANHFRVRIDDLVNADLSDNSTPVHMVAEPNTKYSASIPSGIPLIPIDAVAGLGKGDQSVLTLQTDRYVIPEFNKKADFLIRISGTSMSPKYFHGDIVACKMVSTKTFLQWGKVYVMDTEQGALCKRVYPGTKEGHVKIVSENATQYPDFELPWSEVRSLSIVVGVIRLE